MPISNRHTPYVQNKVKSFPAAEQTDIDNALDKLEHETRPPGYRRVNEKSSYADTFRTIEIVNGILIDYKFDIKGLVTIIDIRRSNWYVLKNLIGDFSPPGGRI